MGFGIRPSCLPTTLQALFRSVMICDASGGRIPVNGVSEVVTGMLVVIFKRSWIEL